MDNEPLLQIRELRKAFGEQKVLDGIDLDLNKGETLTVLGRSGTGKSVLLKLIIGLQKPDSGSIRIKGSEVTTMKTEQLDDVRKKMGFLFQYLRTLRFVERGQRTLLFRCGVTRACLTTSGGTKCENCCRWWEWRRPRRRCPRKFRAE